MVYSQEVRSAQPVKPATPVTPPRPKQVPAAKAVPAAPEASEAKSKAEKAKEKEKARPATAAGGSDPVLTIAVDGSLSGVIRELVQTFADQYSDAPSIAVELTNAGTLQNKLAEAPRWNVVIVAGMDEAKALTNAGRIDQEGQKLVARNTLVVYGRRPKDPGLANAKWPALMGTEWQTVALGTPGLTASGRTAEAVLKKRDLLGKLEAAKAITYGGTESIVLNYLKKGEADALLLLKTDLRMTSTWPPAAKQLLLEYAVYAIDEADYAPVMYTAALLPGTSRKEEALEFITFLVSPAARAIWVKYGFPAE
ncbi:MAG: molybdate ABC transporter substrate-binding protein [Candidatus Methylacidiphilales bacterium]